MSSTPPPTLPHLEVPLGVAHRQLWEQVTDVLREWIMDGQLPPGTRLVERSLAETLGVSRLPVRDAINVLKGEGLLTQEPRRGVVVRGVTRDDLEKLFEVRSALEVLAARLAASRATPDGIGRLRDLLADADEALRARAPGKLHRSNQDFHDAIVDLAQNDLLSSMLRPLEGRVHWLLRQNDEPESMQDQHRALFEAIASNDTAAAASVALDHVNTSRELAMRLLFRSGTPEHTGEDAPKVSI